MTKINFLLSLNEKLSDLPREDVEERLSFYSEMIEDRMEEGLSEEEAVAAVGTVADIAAQIKSDIPARANRKSAKRRSPWSTVLLILGSPVWVPLLIAAIAILLSLYISLWAIVISLWAVFASLIGCSFCGIAVGAGFAFSGNVLQGIALIGAGLVCAGLGILLFYGCNAATKGCIILAKKCFQCIKNHFRKKEAV